MVEREADPADRRRTLIWLTPAGHDVLRRQREVLSADLLGGALSRMHPDQADALMGALRALVQLATPPWPTWPPCRPGVTTPASPPEQANYLGTPPCGGGGVWRASRPNLAIAGKWVRRAYSGTGPRAGVT